MNRIGKAWESRRVPTMDLLTFAGTSEGVKKSWLVRERAQKIEQGKFDEGGKNILRRLGDAMDNMKGTRQEKVAKIVGVIGKEKGVMIVGDPAKPDKILIPTGEKGAAILGKLQNSLLRGATSKRSKGEIRDTMTTLRDAFKKMKAPVVEKTSEPIKAPEKEKVVAPVKSETTPAPISKPADTVSLLNALPRGTKITVDSAANKRMNGTWTLGKNGGWTNQDGARISSKKMASVAALKDELDNTHKLISDVRSGKISPSEAARQQMPPVPKVPPKHDVKPLPPSRKSPTMDLVVSKGTTPRGTRPEDGIRIGRMKTMINIGKKRGKIGTLFGTLRDAFSKIGRQKFSSDVMEFAGTSEGVRKAWLKRERAKEEIGTTGEPGRVPELRSGDRMGTETPAEPKTSSTPKAVKIETPKADVAEKAPMSPETRASSLKAIVDKPVPDRLATWKGMSVADRDNIADAPNSVKAAISSRLEGVGERPMAGPKAVEERLSQIGDRISPDAHARISAHMDRLGEQLKAAGVRDEDVHQVKMDATDAIAAQEMESMGRTLGDHGVRHILANAEISNAILDKMGNKDPKAKLAATLACIYHDTGYLTTPSQNFLDEGHLRWSQQHFDANVAPGLSKLVGPEVVEQMSNIISTHDAENIDWENDPVASAVRVADNMALFHKEKLPALFKYVPENQDVLARLGKNEISVDKAREIATENVKNSKLPDRQKEALFRAAKEMNSTTPKFTLGMLGGEIEGIEFDDPPRNATLTLKRSEDANDANKVLDLGQRQFDKFAKTYGADPKKFGEADEFDITREGKLLLKVKVTGSKKKFGDLSTTMLLFADHCERMEFAGTSEGARKSWLSRERAKERESMERPMADLVRGESGEERAKLGYDERLVETHINYKGNVAKATFRELIQNSIDSFRTDQPIPVTPKHEDWMTPIQKAWITRRSMEEAERAPRMIPGAKIDINYDSQSKVFEVRDNGAGMTKHVLSNEFVNLGGSQKTGSENIGGFGLAKAAFLGNSDMMRIETVAVDPDRGGKKFLSVAEGSTKDWRTVGLKITSQEVPDSTPTGSKMRFDIRKDVNFDHGTDGGEGYLQEYFLFNKLPVTLNYSLDGKLEYSNDPKASPSKPDHNFIRSAKLLSTIPFNGGAMDIYVGDQVEEKSHTAVQVLNNGMPQLLHHIYLNDKAKLPNVMAINVRSNCKPEEPNYPFTMDRDNLREEATRALQSYIKSEMVSATIKDENAGYRKALKESVQIKGTHLRIVNTIGDGFDKSFIDTIANSPAIADIMRAASHGYRDMAEHAAGVLSEPVIEGGGKLVGIGLGTSYRGVNIPMKWRKADEPDAILINPLNGMSPALTRDPGTKASLIAGQITSVLVHEMAHIRAHSHDVPYASELTLLNGVTTELQGALTKKIRTILMANNGAHLNEMEGLTNEYDSKRHATRHVPDIFAKISSSASGAGPGPIGEGLPEDGARSRRKRFGDTVEPCVSEHAESNGVTAILGGSETVKFSDAAHMMSEQDKVAASVGKTGKGISDAKDRASFDVDAANQKIAEQKKVASDWHNDSIRDIPQDFAAKTSDSGWRKVRGHMAFLSGGKLFWGKDAIRKAAEDKASMPDKPDDVTEQASVTSGGSGEGKPKKEFTPEEAKQVGDKMGLDWKNFDIEEFRMGLGVELEHADPAYKVVDANDWTSIGKIAAAHLTELKNYYTLLKQMEEGAKKKMSAETAEGANEVPKELQQKILQYVIDNENLDDTMFHKFVESIGIDPHEAEELVYAELRKIEA